MAKAWSTTTYTGGTTRQIADLVAEGTHRVEAWGNSAEGWFPHLVSTADGIGVECGPHFWHRYGDRLSDLREAAARTYGIDPSAVKRGKAWF